MIVMPSSNTGFQCGVLFGRYPKRMAHIQNGDIPKEPSMGFPWALDNGVYGAWQRGAAWCEEPFYKYLDKYSAWKPMWIVVPDSVGDRDRTLQQWENHWHAVSAFGHPLAFAVQDGMTPEDVPKEADVIFVGGSTSWKWRTLKTWTKSFPRVHVGRVNTYKLLWQADFAGAESCDGTGWFRGDRKQLAGLLRYLDESENGGQLQPCLL